MSFEDGIQRQINKGYICKNCNRVIKKQEHFLCCWTTGPGGYKLFINICAECLVVLGDIGKKFILWNKIEVPKGTKHGKAKT